jgi:pantetheine-phosphate adenylyltransferase
MSRFTDKAFFAGRHSLADRIRQEKKTFGEHQSIPYPVYRRERIEFLKEQSGSDDSLAFMESFAPLIGVFAGSFNPFHKGHYNILQKAERIFDKVIIAFGKNPEKGGRDWPVPNAIRNRQVEEYNGLLTDFIEKLGHDSVVIRGLRNSTDFDYEQNQYRYIQELMPGIRIVNIFCDKEYEHISSSGIRTLEKFGKHHQYLLE